MFFFLPKNKKFKIQIKQMNSTNCTCELVEAMSNMSILSKLALVSSIVLVLVLSCVGIYLTIDLILRTHKLDPIEIVVERISNPLEQTISSETLRTTNEIEINKEH